MPFLTEIVDFINTSLQAGVLNKEKLQPQKFFGLTTPVLRKKSNPQPETFPAVIDAFGKDTPITPDSKLALQVYHKVNGKAYGYDKSAHYGDKYNMNCTTEMQLLVITNAAITGRAKEVLEPLFIFGLPQQVPGLGLLSCIITPIASNLDAVQVFKQEYPQSTYFLNEQMSMFSIRYRIEMAFNQACIDACLCN